MCQIEVGDSADPAILVTPIAEFAFDRRHPIARDIADCRRLGIANTTDEGARKASRDLQPGRGTSGDANVREIQGKRSLGAPRRMTGYGASSPFPTAKEEL